MFLYHAEFVDVERIMGCTMHAALYCYSVCHAASKRIVRSCTLKCMKNTKLMHALTHVILWCMFESKIGIALEAFEFHHVGWIMHIPWQTTQTQYIM